MKQKNESFNKQEMDGLFKRENGKKDNIEIDTSYNRKAILKNCGYVLDKLRSGEEIDQKIFYIGDGDVTSYYADGNIYIPSNVIHTKKLIWGPTRLNAIKYKILKNKELDGYDILDMWILPVYGNVKSESEIVEELVHLSGEFKTSEFLSGIYTAAMINWICNVFSDINKIDKLIKVLKMNKCVTVEDMLESAIYARAHVIYTQQAEELEKTQNELNNTEIELENAKTEIKKKDRIIKDLKNKLKK